MILGEPIGMPLKAFTISSATVCRMQDLTNDIIATLIVVTKMVLGLVYPGKAIGPVQGPGLQDDGPFCAVCRGRGFIPTGAVCRVEHITFEQGRPSVQFQKYDVYRICFMCGGMGQMHRRT